MKVTVIPVVIGAVGSVKRIDVGIRLLGNKRTSGDPSKLQHFLNRPEY